MFGKATILASTVALALLATTPSAQAQCCRHMGGGPRNIGIFRMHDANCGPSRAAMLTGQVPVDYALLVATRQQAALSTQMLLQQQQFMQQQQQQFMLQTATQPEYGLLTATQLPQYAPNLNVQQTTKVEVQQAPAVKTQEQPKEKPKRKYYTPTTSVIVFVPSKEEQQKEFLLKAFQSLGK
jgi:hypothetical protein